VTISVISDSHLTELSDRYSSSQTIMAFG